jgi:hypothetical protein
MVDSFELEGLLVFLLIAVIATLPVALMLGVVYFVVTWPFRLLERARFLLDVVSAALAKGDSPERTLVQLARRHERAFGPHLHLLTAHIERGLTLGQSLAKVPQLMPPAVAVMVRVGEEIGDLRKVLPAASRVLSDEMSHAREAQYHTVALGTATSLMLAWVIWTLGNFVFPKFDALLFDFAEGRELVGWMLFSTFAGHVTGWVLFLAGSVLVMWIWTLLCVGGMERMLWASSQSPWLAALIWHWLPWRYKRLQRDFSFLLATLLDAHVPEEKAVAMAAAGTANPGIERRAGAVIEDLKAGLWLPSAIKHLDDEGELAWRFRHAAYSQKGFTVALKGWQEALDTSAMKEERIAIDATNLAVILFNGLMVGLVTFSVFQFIITSVDLTSPW